MDNKKIGAIIGITLLIIIIIVIYHESTKDKTCSSTNPAGTCPTGQTCIIGACAPSKNLLTISAINANIVDYSDLSTEPIQDIGIYIPVPTDPLQKWTISNYNKGYQLQNSGTSNCLYMNSATDYGVTKCGSPGTTWGISPGLQINSATTSQCLTAQFGNNTPGSLSPTQCGDSTQITLTPAV